MNAITALFKKELHTAKWFFLGGLLFFWSFPLLQLAGNYYCYNKLQADMPSSMAIVFGGLYAIITAAGLVCLDLPRGLYEFWRSKPIKLIPHLLIKYVLGLVIVLFVITIPVRLEIALSEYDTLAIGQRTVLYCHTFIILLIYSVAFCIGHLIHNMTESVVISCAVALLIYFVPLLVPAMESFSFFNILFLRPPISFYELLVLDELSPIRHLVVTAIALSVILFAAAWVCLKRHLQIQLGLKSMCWCLGLVALILFSAAAFSVGSNLNCEAKITLPVDEKKVTVGSFFDDKDGILLCGRYFSDGAGYDILQIIRIREESTHTRRMDSYTMKPLVSVQCPVIHEQNRIAWSKQQPQIVFFLGTASQYKQENGVVGTYSLYVIQLDDNDQTARIQSQFSLGEYKISDFDRAIIFDQQYIYINIAEEIIVVDVSNIRQPRQLLKFRYHNTNQVDRQNRVVFTLPDEKDLSDRQRYSVMQYFGFNRFRDWIGVWDNERFAMVMGDSICVYAKKEFHDMKVCLEKIAESKPLPLEKLMYAYPQKVILNKDRVFLLRGTGNLTVYQLDELSCTLKRIGHYAAPEGDFHDMFLRDDGNIALVGPKQIHIVLPPIIKK